MTDLKKILKQVHDHVISSEKAFDIIEHDRVKASCSVYDGAYEDGARDALLNGFALVYTKTDDGRIVRAKIRAERGVIVTTEAE